MFALPLGYFIICVHLPAFVGTFHAPVMYKFRSIRKNLQRSICARQPGLSVLRGPCADVCN